MKKKNIIAIVLVFLVIGIFIGIILLSSDPSSVQRPVNPGPGTEDPEDPEHDYKWELVRGDAEYHWYEAYCSDHKGQIKNGSKEKHSYDSDEVKQEKTCSVCGRTEPIPTKQEDLDITFDEDGNATVGGLADSTNHVDRIVIGPVKDENGEDVPTKVKDEAFRRDTSLKTLIILDGVTELGANAFSDCSDLERIEISKTVEKIDSETFKNCKSLKRIYVDDANPYFIALGDCLIRKVDKCLILGCIESVIPDTNRKEGGQYIVTQIGPYAFCGSGIKELVVPENISAIGIEAFRDCKSLKNITLSESVIRIDNSTFYGCEILETINLHDKIEHIGQSAFRDCKALDNITLPQNLKTISISTFSGCTSLKNITLNEGLTGIANSAFSGCTSLESITLPKSVIGIGSSVFSGCSKLAEIIYAGTEAEWNENVKSLGSNWNNGVDVTFTTPDADGGGDADSSSSGSTDDDGDSSGSADADNQN